MTGGESISSIKTKSLFQKSFLEILLSAMLTNTILPTTSIGLAKGMSWVLLTM